MVLAHSWTTTKCDYTSEFSQAEIKEQLYVEQPKGFENLKDKISKILPVK